MAMGGDAEVIDRQDRVGSAGAVALSGHVRVYDGCGRLLTQGHNRVVDAGIGAIVDAMATGGEMEIFRYVGFGTASGVTGADTTTLEAEVSSAGYQRLCGEQGEGDNSCEYRVSGTWTNGSGQEQRVCEYGLLSAATGGTMLARVSSGDSGGPGAQTVAPGGTLSLVWDIQFADA